jgi:hypothetical protein
MEAAGCWVCECTEMVVCGESVGSRLRLRALTDHRFAYSPFRVKSRETDDKTCLARKSVIRWVEYLEEALRLRTLKQSRLTISNLGHQ